MTPENSSDTHRFGDAALAATVSAMGAELTRLDSLQPESGNTGGATRALLWGAGPAWPRHSPVLFPIVGRIPNDTSHLEDKPVHLTQHGFARDRVFQWVERTETGCVLELSDDTATRALLPSAFTLRLTYSIADGTLSVRYEVHNPDANHTLHASLGAHPAFRWPQSSKTRDGHTLTFSKDETGPIRRVVGGLLAPTPFPSPVEGRTLPLVDALFEHDALIFAPVQSTSVRFTGPDGAGLEMTWDNFPELGVWTKPGAGFLCIEPWHGYAAPAGFADDFSVKPGHFHIPPEGRWSAGWTVRAI